MLRRNYGVFSNVEEGRERKALVDSLRQKKEETKGEEKVRKQGTNKNRVQEHEKQVQKKGGGMKQKSRDAQLEKRGYPADGGQLASSPTKEKALKKGPPTHQKFPPPIRKKESEKGQDGYFNQEWKRKRT